eukprot:Skav202278  [mRNA]  locus=scaffold3044:133526:134380:- [translate_table: standard]
MFSGRRRHGDYQMWCEHFLGDKLEHYIVVSLDTAVNDQMDITTDKVWNWLLQAARQSRILALLLGPPCESWSSARHEKLLDAQGHELAAPRPIRDALHPWGLTGNTPAENAQICTGTTLLLRGLRIAYIAGMNGARIVMEHPAAPWQEDRASVWRTSVVRHLLEMDGVFQMTTLRQFQFGAAGVKPTTFLYSGCNLEDSMQRLARLDLPCPSTALIGKENGRFATFKAKEYPMLLNYALALCATHEAPAHPKRTEDEWSQIADEFTQASRWSKASEILADYQAR